MTVTKGKVLVIDDNLEISELVKRILKNRYDVITANTGDGGFSSAVCDLPDIILLDILLPDIDGYEVCRRLKKDKKTSNIPVVFMTGLSGVNDEAKGFDAGGVEYITKPFNLHLLRARINTHLELKCYRDKLVNLVNEKTKELILTQRNTIECISAIAEFRNHYTGEHIHRCKAYMKILCDALLEKKQYHKILSTDYIKLLSEVSPLHDIGKIVIPDNILLKPGKLTLEEFEIIKTHSEKGAEIIDFIIGEKLKNNKYLQCGKEMALAHHEKWNGTGYPYGLAGDKIPLAGRLMAIVDVYDALVSKRVYKDAFSHKRAVKIIKEGSGKDFDPMMVDAYLSVNESFSQVYC